MNWGEKHVIYVSVYLDMICSEKQEAANRNGDNDSIVTWIVIVWAVKNYWRIASDPAKIYTIVTYKVPESAKSGYTSFFAPV